ncbi:MAG: Peptide deformylase [Candidatus Yanofskybacteria bacterium GW2011_GWF1_44_227]|uniref:Peptide deformylase n=1 Tax=Candidatus Yanofskybacteria bacterium GW2011_GWE2_40_11 TaxID=1619033 RepID=A0A0G0TTM4_9BACT|nr:MAG: Peptide deformylase [Candidatus Yanofskybacteria bacterium GW2011_GWE1_40_10]KKR41237.1 MAG: Peptide deformylase [Candidatus Yanofskybacteria bacterium GW2011_GWE2_40_11]KKT15687.1 MAG: Peptide deformylase [Candidatus Yanofskybacteria bacterium GW2011_GWF2_43_596]KKT53425.1 MAG: Peptide deformylase [Candidatus Yanofskybacteria bacterium GW2011_GWF1_44_227]OGN36165.1 MAG: peptide deformylase [Candidatus Yanofskybacteria bacterium RIFOXYA2_FULL_45_28]OGN36881.1 MAG: peptide deformylase [
MAEITKIPEKILRKILEKIDPEDIKNGAYTTLISDMKVSMLKNEGVGLAANQIGKDLAIFVIAPYLAKEHDVPEVYFNPEITEYSKELDELEEGCLSIPKYFAPIKRSKKVMIKFVDEQGKKQKIKARGFLARVYQHETDHLHGLVIKDRK